MRSCFKFLASYRSRVGLSDHFPYEGLVHPITLWQFDESNELPTLLPLVGRPRLSPSHPKDLDVDATQEQAMKGLGPQKVR